MSTVVVAVAVAWVLLLAAYRRRLSADWREPVLSAPVLIVESDDWGPGPLRDAQRLREIAALLGDLRDGSGQPPVFTLGIVLAAPGGATPNETEEPSYAPLELDAKEVAPIREAMLAGRDAGVFALHLHAMEHFWPPALLKRARSSAAVHAFLRAEQGVPRHEVLPPHLQARWIDAAQLPSTALDAQEIERAVAEEAVCFRRVCGDAARVAVPVAFTWTPAVESAWARHGIRVVVTPGTRNIGRDAQGRLISDGSVLRNGDIAAGGIVLVVRDIYFEPALGHTAAHALREVGERARLGRPALLEMHRFNFTGDDAQAERSTAELRNLLAGALERMPRLRFMSTEALAEALRARDPALIDDRMGARIRTFLLRAATEGRLRKLAWISGLALVAAFVLAVISAFVAQPSSAAQARG